MTDPTSSQFEVGPFRVDVVRRRLLRDGAAVALTPKVFDLLLAFLAQPGEVLSKDALLHTLWPDVVVEENNLTHAIAKLRKALGDDIHERRFIVTVPGLGYRFVADVRGTAALTPTAAELRPVSRPVSRLMVMPFKILRTGSAYDFLAFSVPDAISSSLSGFDSLSVRSSAAAARFAGEPLDLEAIARHADVDAVLHGTLLHDAGEVRISAQLVRVPEGTVSWSTTVQAAHGDVFQLQDVLTRGIVDALAVELTPSDQQRLGRTTPRNARAYELYLRANQLSTDQRYFDAARDLYLQSIAQDPTYAPAWARLGRIYRVIGKFGAKDMPESVVLGEGAFKRALALSPDLPIAHGLYAYLEADVGRAQQAIVRLLRLPETPNDPELLAGLVHVCRYCGLLEESVAAHQLARRLDPTVRTSVSQTHWTRLAHQSAFDEDIENPTIVWVFAVEALGRAAEALTLVDEALRRPSLPPIARIFMSTCRATIAGDRATALGHTDELLGKNFPDPEGIYRLGWMLARLREDDRAIVLLERAVEGGFAAPFHLSGDPWFAPIRGSAGFARILAAARDREMTARSAFVALDGPALVAGSARHHSSGTR